MDLYSDKIYPNLKCCVCYESFEYEKDEEDDWELWDNVNKLRNTDIQECMSFIHKFN